VILTFVEHESGAPAAGSLEMLTIARALAGELGAPLHAVLVGEGAETAAAELGSYGVAAAHVADVAGDFGPGIWAQAIVTAISDLAATHVVAAGTDRGNEVMAHVGAKTGLAFAANCTEVGAGEPLVATRLRWGGSLLEEARLSGSPKLLTTALHAATPEQVPPVEIKVERFSSEPSEADLLVRVVERVAADSSKISLPEAAVVVGGGRGVGSAEGFAKLEDLAALLGGAVGVSRAVTSLGWRPHSEQVGQTGTRIAPDLYIACGISGAIQHMVGCKAAKKILAINTDPEAPIMAKADFAVIGDVNAVLPAISEEIRRREA
jgi:electron transfer flavoprotein alpha subunit